jgi:hypothetical protein
MIRRTASIRILAAPAPWFFEIKGSGTALTGTVLIDNLNGSYKEPDFELTLLRMWLVLGRAE